MPDFHHVSVMNREVCGFFSDKKGGVILDCTLGAAGHTLGVLEALDGDCTVVGLDQDSQAIKHCIDKLNKFSESIVLEQSNFVDFDIVLKKHGIVKVDGVVFDLGVSSNQLDDPERGFSFRFDSPLDMRMNQGDEEGITAADIINYWDEFEIARVLYEYGDEYKSRAIARAIVNERKKGAIETTTVLAKLVERVYGKRSYYKIHPATKTFQALRIAVNKELDALKQSLEKLPDYLNDNAVVCVISFHSLEDRIAKHTFRRLAKEGKLEVLTKKPLRANDEERANNPRSRSAKLRVAKRSLQL